MNMSNEDILFLREVNGLGFHRLRQMVESEITITELQQWKEKDWHCIKGISVEKTYTDFHNKYNDTVLRDRIIKSIDLSDYVTNFWDKNYPIKLKHSSSPPIALFLKGNTNCFQKTQLAIIGSRMPSQYGQKNAKNFTKKLCESNISILSGFARGIDTIAHKTALEMNSNTIAVLGTSLDIIYPNENVKLFNEIIESGGLIISEYLYQTKPDARNFPKRNRIIASLADAILVAEASAKSGAIITAEMAFKEKVNVFAIPGNIDSKNSVGSNSLIKSGANITTNAEDLMESLNIKETAGNRKQLSFLDFSKEEESILNVIGNDPIYIDKIAENLQKKPYEILADVLNLELKQCIRKLEGNYFIKTL